AAWLFGLSTDLDEIRRDTEAPAGAEGTEELDADDDEDEDTPEAVDENFLNAARELLARELLRPERLEEGLPGLSDEDLEALRWLLDRGGMAPLDEYLKAHPPNPASPGDMLLENGIVAEG